MGSTDVREGEDPAEAPASDPAVAEAVRFDRWDALAGAAVALGLWAFALGPHDVGVHDPAIYLEMAADPLGEIPLSPFCFRIGAPFLAAALPLPNDLAFIALTWVGLVGTILVVRRTTTAIAGRARGLAAAGLVGGSAAVLTAVRTPYATEPLSLLACAASAEFARRRRWEMAGICLLGGTLVREGTLVVLLPLLVWCLRTEPDVRTRAKSAGLLALPGLAVYLLLHKTPLLYGVVLSERFQPPSEIWAWNVRTPGGFGRYLVAVALGSLGLLWPLLPRAVRPIRGRGPIAFAATGVLIMVPLAAATATVSDWGRVLAFGIVGVAPAVAATAPQRLLAPLAATQLAIGALVLADRTWIAVAVAAVAVVAWWLERRSRRGRPSEDQADGSFDQLASTAARVRTP
ncbi:MAG: hypothetical protein R2701_07875 [Acidimicrobiales bacterium]